MSRRVLEARSWKVADTLDTYRVQLQPVCNACNHFLTKDVAIAVSLQPRYDQVSQLNETRSGNSGRKGPISSSFQALTLLKAHIGTIGAA